MKSWLIAASLCSVVLAAPSSAQTEKPAPVRSAAGMTAEKVLARFVEVTGGVEAYKKITTTVTRGTVELKAQGIKGTMETTSKAPNLFRSSQNIAGIGEMLQGYDGKVAWSKDPINGLRELEGVEKALALRASAFNAPIRWRELYKKAALTGSKKIGDADAWVVVLTPAVGKPVVQYYDKKTGLMVRMDIVAEGPQGTIPTETLISDYREVDGVKTPFRAVTKLGSAIEMELVTTEVKNNVPVEDSIFAKPAK
jgi:hypothetical protein